MAGNDFPKFEFPTDMHAFAEKSMEQARKAFDSFVEATQRAMSDLEDRAQTARTGAMDVSGRAMTFAERNMAASFEFAQNLVRARTPEDVLRLQTDYVKAQIQTLNEQTKELAEATAKVAKETTQARS